MNVKISMLRYRGEMTYRNLALSSKIAMEESRRNWTR